MAGGYSLTPVGTEGVAGKFKDLQAQLDAQRSGAGIRSSVLRGVELLFQAADGTAIGKFGTFPFSKLSDTDPGVRETDTAKGVLFEDSDGNNLLLIAQYESDGSTEVQLKSEDVLITTDDYMQLWSKDDMALFADTEMTLVAGTGMTLVAGGRLTITGIPITSSSANVFLGTVGADYTLARISSSLKYKQDVEDAEIDPADVLAMQPRTWRDRYEVEHDPESDRRFVGFIAEELHELPSLRHFVDYDENGEPDAIEYDRLTVALLALAKDQQKRLDDIETRLTALEPG